MFKRFLKISINVCLFLGIALSAVMAFGDTTFEYDGFYDYSIACKDENWKKNYLRICSGQKFSVKSTFRFDGKKLVGEYAAKEIEGGTSYGEYAFNKFSFKNSSSTAELQWQDKWGIGKLNLRTDDDWNSFTGEWFNLKDGRHEIRGLWNARRTNSSSLNSPIREYALFVRGEKNDPSNNTQISQIKAAKEKASHQANDKRANIRIQCEGAAPLDVDVENDTSVRVHRVGEYKIETRDDLLILKESEPGGAFCKQITLNLLSGVKTSTCISGNSEETCKIEEIDILGDTAYSKLKHKAAKEKENQRTAKQIIAKLPEPKQKFNEILRKHYAKSLPKGRDFPGAICSHDAEQISDCISLGFRGDADKYPVLWHLTSGGWRSVDFWRYDSVNRGKKQLEDFFSISSRKEKQSLLNNQKKVERFLSSVDMESEMDTEEQCQGMDCSTVEYPYQSTYTSKSQGFGDFYITCTVMKPSQMIYALKSYLSIDDSVANLSWYTEKPICFSSIYHDDYSKAVLIYLMNSSGPIQLMGSDDIWPGDVLLVKGRMAFVLDTQFGGPKRYKNMVQDPNFLMIGILEEEKHVLLKDYVGEPYQALKITKNGGPYTSDRDEKFADTERIFSKMYMTLLTVRSCAKNFKISLGKLKTAETVFAKYWSNQNLPKQNKERVKSETKTDFKGLVSLTSKDEEHCSSAALMMKNPSWFE